MTRPSDADLRAALRGGPPVAWNDEGPSPVPAQGPRGHSCADCDRVRLPSSFPSRCGACRLERKAKERAKFRGKTRNLEATRARQKKAREEHRRKKQLNTATAPTGPAASAGGP